MTAELLLGLAGWVFALLVLYLAHNERRELLNRIQAQMPQVLERLDAHAARTRPAKPDDREDALEEETEFVPRAEVVVSAAEGRQIIQGIAGRRR